MLKVLDFGIAKAMQDGESATQLSTRTSSGFSAFSPPYGAPEQFRARRYGPTGPWTDVHALGLILTELVTGERALTGEEHGVPLDEARASKLFEKACNGGLADGCTALGWAYLNAAGVAPNVDRARDLFSRACNGGDASACTKLGVMVGAGESADEGRAAELYAKGCDGGDLMGCVQLGRCYQRGEGVKKDPDRARANFQKACEGGESSGCDALPRSSSSRAGPSR